MMDGNIKEAKILIVDDEESNVLLLEELLGYAGYTNLRVPPIPAMFCLFSCSTNRI